jgi:hypothetical protein
MAAYENATNNSIEFVRCQNAACTSRVTQTIANNQDDLGNGVGMTVDSNGYPLITYHNNSKSTLNLFRCDNVSCSTGTNYTLTDGSEDQGEHSDIVKLNTPSDEFLISHYNRTDGKLELYHFRDVAYGGSDIGTNVNPFDNIYASRFSGDDLTIANFDVAEEYEVLDETIGPGDVVRFMEDNNGNELLVERASSKCSEECDYDDSVIGVVSTEPGLYLKDWEKNKTNGRPVALVGRVPVKVSLENGPIDRGDYLVAASTPGYAMKATSGGMIIGRAMESFDGQVSLDEGGDSPTVQKYMQGIEDEIDEVLDLVTTSAQEENDGKIMLKPELEGVEEESIQVQEKDVEEVKQEVDEIKQKLTATPVDVISEDDPSEKGRVMMYVDLNYVSDEAFLERQRKLDSVEVGEFAAETGNKLFDIVQDTGGVKLVTAGDLQIDGTVAANVITAADVEDLTIRLNENTALKVVNKKEETVFAVDSSGSIVVGDSEESSANTVTIAAGEQELFIEDKDITDSAVIFASSQTGERVIVRDVKADEGFTLSIAAPRFEDVEVGYFIIY